MSLRLSRRDRIYPVAVKPQSNYNRWSSWPADCVDSIRSLVAGWYSTGGVFKCFDCAAFCHPHPQGVPHLNVDSDGRRWVRGNPMPIVLCDDCLIARARRSA